MGKSVLVDTRDMKLIVGANSAIASSVATLLRLAEKMPEASDEKRLLLAELRKMLDGAETIQSSVDTVIRENQ